MNSRPRHRTALVPRHLLAVAAAVLTLSATAASLDEARAAGPARSATTMATAQDVRGRRPVLPQVEVPHAYYWREMYVPQVTAGPRSPAWAHDGEQLVYSMGGSLWRQETGSTTAVQLTDGPGYHHQPDWSPDGDTIVYAAYDGEAIELHALDVASGESRALTANGAVNLEPRFSPSGDRLAFVSTVEFGRWHVFVAPFENGRLGEPRRVTEDRDSELPRYYYSVYDHYLSPTWSPDGDELIVVSNRGRIWGSGGFWRLPLDGEGEAREIRYEETTWRARPDWSPDGRRVVYASYLGRQRHQLWLMTAEGGDVFPVTYEAFAEGGYDATEPRWSPDGRRIAYVSNQGGNTSLWVLDVPGGGPRQVEVADRQWLRPTGDLEIAVTDADGASLPARVSVIGADDRGWTPADALRHADDAFDRAERSFEPTYFHSPGSSRLEVPAGAYTVEVWRGPEYDPVRRQVSVAEGQPTRVTVALERIAEPEADGWYSGDLHVHMNYGGAYAVDPELLIRQAAAEDLDVVENTVVNKEQRVPDIAAFRTDRDPASTPGNHLFHGQEFHTSLWGHSALLGLQEHFLLPDYAAYVNTPAASPYPHNAAAFDLAHAQGAIVGYVHPFDSVPDPTDRSVPLNHELPVDVALGKVDYLEVVGFSDHLATAEVWYRLLNCGFRLPAGAGTDAMTNFASLRGPVGTNRTYVKVDGDFHHRAFLDGVRAGRTVATNGPLLTLSIGDAGIGDEIELPAGTHRLRVTGTLRSAVPVDHLQLVRNGEVVAELPLAVDRRSAEVDETVEVDASGWYTLRAWSEQARHPVLDIYPFGTTSPIWVTVDGQPVRSAEAAAYFDAWIARLEETAEASDAWNTETEREAVLESLARAREVMRERGAGS